MVLASVKIMYLYKINSEKAQQIPPTQKKKKKKTKIIVILSETFIKSTIEANCGSFY